MNTKQLLLPILILSIATGNTFSMFKKFTQPAQNALKNQFAATFNFSNIVPESLNTLIAYNKNTRNNAILRSLCATPIAIAAILVKLDSIDPLIHRYTINKELMIERTLTNFLFVGSLVYAAKQGHSVYIRQWTLHNLKKIKNNSSNLFDQQFVKKITHEDIKNKISRATVVPSDKKTNATTTLNINNTETLAEVLSGKFNKSENILTTV